MKRIIKNILLLCSLLIIVCLTISSCAPKGYTPDSHGFFSGVWHGICFPFSLMCKLFGAKIGLYAKNNTGFFYWIGFIFGAGGMARGAARSKY